VRAAAVLAQLIVDLGDQVEVGHAVLELPQGRQVRRFGDLPGLAHDGDFVFALDAAESEP
jgi:hypothetical protein